MQAVPALQPQALAVAQWWQRLRCWVLAEPAPADLVGQRCDRLRPRFIAHALHQELPRQAGADAALVEWHWDSSTGQVSGLLLAANQLLHFHWIPGLQRFQLHPVAALQPKWWPPACRQEREG
jgi:hypothetical protein